MFRSSSKHRACLRTATACAVSYRNSYRLPLKQQSQSPRRESGLAENLGLTPHQGNQKIKYWPNYISITINFVSWGTLYIIYLNYIPNVSQQQIHNKSKGDRYCAFKKEFRRFKVQKIGLKYFIVHVKKEACSSFFFGCQSRF